MKVAFGFSQAARFKGSVVSPGMFDGVHAGHRRLLAAAAERARARGALSVALTFDPLAARVLDDSSPPPRMPVMERLERLEDAGVDAAVVLRFDARLAATEAGRFAAGLACGLRPCEVVVGSTFRFGRDREGTAAALEALGRDLGFDVTIIPVEEP